MSRNIIWAVDLIQLRNITDQSYFDIRGWGFSKDGKPLTYKVFIDEKEVEHQLTVITVDDVKKKYEEYLKTATIGFKIKVPAPENPGSIRIVVSNGKDTDSISKSKSFIEQTKMDGEIEFGIKEFTYNADAEEYKINGYAVDVLMAPVDLTVLDESNNVVPCSILRFSVLELSIKHICEDENRTCGFIINFKGEKDKKYTLAFKSIHDEKSTLLVENEQQNKLSVDKVVNIVQRGIRYLKYNGIKKTIRRFVKGRDLALDDYAKWFEKSKVTEEELKVQRNTKFSFAPTISIIVATFNTKESYLKEMIDSVVDQSYPKWQLCIGDGSTNDSVERYVKANYGHDSRIVFKKLEKNYGISGNMNGALELVTGDYVGLFDHDDLLTPDCLFEIVSSMQEVHHDVVYTDEDKLNDEMQIFMDPHFKPDFSPDQLCSHNYITHFFVVNMDIVRQVGGMRSEYDGSQDYDFIFRCTEVAKSVHHVPKILYHWRMHMESTAANPESKMYCYTAGKKAIEAHFERVGLKGQVEMLPFPFYGLYHSTYDTPGNPLVSIIIPNRNLMTTLKTCIDSLFEKNNYKNFEIIIVENNSTEEDIFAYYKELEASKPNVKVITWVGEFNYSAINNYAIPYAKGDYLLFLNNDTEIIAKNSIRDMLGYCMREEIGCVGAKLLYPDNTIQHGGVVVGYKGYATHAFVGPDDFGYMGRTIITSNFSAVTAACLMVKKKDFEAVNGFDPQFKIACNDVDFCLKIRELGKYNVLNITSLWYHFESQTRVLDMEGEALDRFQSEVKKFQEKWPEILEKGDPFHNKNFMLDEGPFTVPHL